MVVIRSFFAVNNFRRHHLVAIVSHLFGRFNGVIGQHSRKILNQRTANDGTSHDGKRSDIKNRFSANSSIITNVGDDERHGGESCRANRKPLADSGSSVADRIKFVRDFPDVMVKMARFSDTTSVVGNRAKSIDRNRSSNEGQHTHSRHRHAIHTRDFTGNENGNTNHQNRQQYRTGTDSVTFSDDKSSTLGRNLCQFTGWTVIGRGVILSNRANANTTSNAKNGGNQRRSPAQHELWIEVFASEQHQRNNCRQDSSATCGKISRVVKFFGRVFAHLVSGNINNAQQARKQTATRNQNRSQNG